MAFSCQRILQNKRVITLTMGPDGAADTAHANRFGEFANVDQNMLVLEHCVCASAVHEDAMADLVLGHAEGFEESVVVSTSAVLCGLSCACG